MQPHLPLKRCRLLCSLPISPSSPPSLLAPSPSFSSSLPLGTLSLLSWSFLLPVLSTFLHDLRDPELNLLCFGFWTLRYKERKWESKRMLDSGGMPSSHSATVTALAVAIALQEGSGGPAFAIALVFACVVCAWFFLSFLFTCLFSFLYFLLLMLWLLKEFGKFWVSAPSAVHSSIVQCLFGILIYNLG